MRGRRWLAALVAMGVVIVSGVATSGASSTTASTTSVDHACAQTRSAHYTHVVWIVLENQGYSVVGSPEAPFLNHLGAVCALATRDIAVSHPSLPNYLALTAGSTLGVSDDAEPAAHPLVAPSIFSELGRGWRALVESMPSACDRVTSGDYAARHNPAVYFLRIRSTCERQDVALKRPLDLSARFTFIVPNVCNDMHSCPVSVGDEWLARTVAEIATSRPYRAHTLALFITFDESDVSASNQVPTFVVAPTVPRGLRVNTPFTHYSLLRTTETLLHLRLLGAARHAPSMVSAFHL